MAFTYRNPLETAINSLPTNFSDQILSSTSEKLVSKVEQLNDLFSFTMRKEVEEALIRKGVELAPLSYQVHSHPACKTIENHLIYRVIPLALNKTPSIALISMREEKAEKFLKVRNYSKFGNITALGPLNSFIDAKDNFRYMDPHNLSSNHSEMVEKLRAECNTNGWFPKTVLVHDELHHWSEKELIRFFREIPEIRTMIGTVVCPVELLLNEKESKNPRIYTFDVCGDEVNFFPDGVASEGYSQSIKRTTWWIKTSYLTDGVVSLRISVIHSLFAHHVIVVDRGSMLQKNFFFEKPDCLLDCELKMLSTNLSGGIVERSTMLSVMTYLSCLKTPNKESALAKLRQLEKRDLFPDEAYLVSSISSTFIKYGVGQEFDESFFERIVGQVFKQLPNFIRERIDKSSYWEGIFRDFLKEISSKTLKVGRKKKNICLEAFVNDPQTSIEDRDPRPYEYTRLPSVGVGLTRFALSLNIYSRAGVAYCPPLVLVPRRDNVTTEVGRTEVLMIEAGSDVNASVAFENTSRNDHFSSSGVVLEQSMNILPFEEPSIQYSLRRNCCVFDSLSHFLNETSEELISKVFNSDISGDLFDAIEQDKPLSIEVIQELCFILDCCCYVQIGESVRKLNLKGRRQAFITLKGTHATPTEKRIFEKMIGEGGLRHAGEASSGKVNLPKVNSAEIDISMERLMKLVKSMKRGCTGIILEISPESIEQLANATQSLSDSYRPSDNLKINYSLSLGVPGSGKSSSIKKWLLDYPMNSCLVVSPRRALAAEWTSSLRGTSHCVCTFESALCQNSTMFKAIILDEISLYPPGFVDLICTVISLRAAGVIRGPMFNKNKYRELIEEGKLEMMPMYMLGDSLQTSYYSSMDSILLDKEHDLVRLIKAVEGKLDYLWYSYRLPRGFEQVLDFQCVGEGKVEDYKFFSEISATKFIDYEAILVASQEDKRNVTVPLVCMTFGESQGLTFEKKALICISNDTLLVSEQALIVALTRSKIGFDFFFQTSRTIEEIRVSFKKKMIGSLLSKFTIKKERLTNLIPSRNVDPIYLAGGLEEKAMNDLFILPEIQPSYPEADYVEVEEPLCEPSWFKTHIPIIAVNPIYAEVFEKMVVKEKREFFHQHRGFSEQFPDTDKGLVEQVMGASFRFDSIFPRHSGSDDVTFWEGVKKRLSFSNPRAERRKLEDARKSAGALLAVFLSKLPNEFKVNNEDIEMGLNSFNSKRAEKTEALWAAHSERSDIDWPLNHIFLFMKSQLCTKQEKMFCNAKAGQTLACFHHSILFRFGPFLRSIERAFLRACGESYYVHSGKNFFMLNEFVLKNQEKFQGDSIESDYEAFDASQDAVVLAFEEALLKKIGVSEGFIRDYVFLKLNLGCRLGSLAIMRFTGEFCTFLFNTFANMLFTFLKYDVKPSKDRILFAGDDMASLGGLKRAKGQNERMLKLFSLKAKEEKKRIPCFCGWYLTPDGILKSPKLLWARICVMKQRGLMETCLDNYFLEAVFAYNLGEKLFQYFDDSELEFHYVVSRFFILNSYKFSGESKTRFFGLKQTFGSKCPLSKSMTSLSGLRSRVSKLTQSSLRRSMEMQVFLGLKFFKLSDALSQISRLVTLVKIRSLSRILIFLIRWSWTSLKRRVVSTRICTLGQFLFASLRSYLTLGVLRARSFYMTRLHLISYLASSQLMKLTLKKGQPSLYSDLNICYQSVTRFLVNPLKSSFKLMVSTSSRIGKSLVSMWVAFIDFQIQLGIFVLTMVTGVGRNKKYGAVMHCHLQRISNMNSELVRKNLSLRLQTWMCTSRVEDPLCLLDKLVEKSSYVGLKPRFMKVLGGLLGQHQLELMNVFQRRRRMSSVQGVIQHQIRQALDQWLWSQYIDPSHAILAAELDLTAVPADKVDLVNTVQVHYKSHLFGNIAILGSSGKTQWPAVDISIPTLIVGEGENRVTKNFTLNMSTVLQALETSRASSRVDSYRTATFRQVCECYAPEAYLFLKRQYSSGVCTNIYKKWPRALESAPWVAFDFCTGLKMNELTPDEKKVIDRLTKRLFRTEGQKGVFEAGQEVNVDLEG